MKKTINKSMMMALALMAISSTGFSAVNGKIKTAKENHELPAEFKYIGTMEGHPLFQLSINNNEDDEYYIFITNANNDVLYSSTLKVKA